MVARIKQRKRCRRRRHSSLNFRDNRVDTLKETLWSFMRVDSITLSRQKQYYEGVAPRFLPRHAPHRLSAQQRVVFTRISSSNHFIFNFMRNRTWKETTLIIGDTVDTLYNFFPPRKGRYFSTELWTKTCYLFRESIVQFRTTHLYYHLLHQIP